MPRRKAEADTPKATDTPEVTGEAPNAADVATAAAGKPKAAGARPKAAANARIYQLKVTLKGIRPPIWRRLQVPADFSLGKLHDVLQIAMGWGDGHLHEFTIGGVGYGAPDPEFGAEVENERTARLGRVAPGEKGRFHYLYDFGDSWEHEILVEKILPREEGVQYPRLLAGKRSAPPEDCGGVWGYEDLLDALRNPDHPEREELLEWVGEDFDPEEFDLEGINDVLQRVG